MKNKKEIKKKLTLNKQSVANLENVAAQDMERVKGGDLTRDLEDIALEVSLRYSCYQTICFQICDVTLQ